MLESDTSGDQLQLLRTIVDSHLTNGQTFFVPWSDKRALQSILLPFKELANQGVALEFIIDACSKSVDLFMALTKNGRETTKKLGIFVDCMEMTYEDAMRFYAKWASGLEEVSADCVQQRLSIFLGRGVRAGAQMRSVVMRCPEILFMGVPQQMDMFWENILDFFTLNDLKKLMVNSPQICLMSFEEIEEIYEYIYFHMGIEPGELAESKYWHTLELDQVMSRHEFLLKTGKYTYPDPKKPQLKKENPPARRIFDVDELEFATKVGCVSHEEWVIFQDMRKQEEILSEKERPYERIKPSLRKQFERRKKEAAEIEMAHLVAIFILLWKIWKTRSVAGISGRSQVIFLLVFICRYLDLFTNFVSVYNSVMKIFFIGSSIATVFFIYFKFKATYDRNHDTLRIEFLVLPCLCLALLINHEFSLFEILWTFSIYLESVAIMPQLFMLSKTGSAETITAHYLFALGSYRGLYILNWIYRYYLEDFLDIIAVVAGIVQTVLYADFFYLYITKVVQQRRNIQLPA
ncbi:hypothetical protein niasHT_004664 [Heterodera trifolii]|uniref:ER lumen protein-retaining receptor n=1 Tax=Heterodera trifolii TaxID=157864 RepID=A0ABD2MBM3_9BILA